MIIPEPIRLSEQDRLRLEGMSNSPNGTLAKRAKIILCCAEGKNNSQVAQELSVDAETVAIWRKKYLQHGIAVLTESFMGAKPKTPYDEVDQRVQKLLKDNHSNDVTIESIMEQVGLSRRQVRDSLTRMDISLSRKSHWEWYTSDETVFSRSGILAVLLSEPLSVVITAKAPWGFTASPGRFLTCNKKVYEDICSVRHTVTIGHVLSASTNRLKSRSTKRGETVLRHVDSLLENLPEFSDLKYHLFSFCNSLPSYTGKRQDDFEMEWFSVQSDWLLAIHDWIGQNSNGWELLQTERLEKGIQKHLESCTDMSDTFVWTRSIMAVGTPDDPFAMEVTDSDVLLDLIREQIPGTAYPSGSDDLNVAAFVCVLDKDGGDYRFVSSDMPIKASEFSFDTPEGFLKGVNNTEMPVANLRDDAGRVLYELLLEAIKKKSLSS